MRRRLVGDDVDERTVAPPDPVEVPLQQLGQHLRGVAEHADRQAAALVAGLEGQLDRVVEVAGLDVEVAGLQAPVDAVLVALDADRDAVVHRDGQRLRAAHAAESGGDGDGAGEGTRRLSLSAIAANVSKVPWRMPWVPM